MFLIGFIHVAVAGIADESVLYLLIGNILAINGALWVILWCRKLREMKSYAPTIIA